MSSKPFCGYCQKNGQKCHLMFLVYYLVNCNPKYSDKAKQRLEGLKDPLFVLPINHSRSELIRLIQYLEILKVLPKFIVSSRQRFFEIGSDDTKKIKASTTVFSNSSFASGPSFDLSDVETVKASTVFPSPSTVFPSPSTVFPSPSTVFPSPSTVFPSPSTVFPSPSTVFPSPSTVFPSPSSKRPQRKLSARQQWKNALVKERKRHSETESTFDNDQQIFDPSIFGWDETKNPLAELLDECSLEDQPKPDNFPYWTYTNPGFLQRQQRRRDRNLKKQKLKEAMVMAEKDKLRQFEMAILAKRAMELEEAEKKEAQHWSELSPWQQQEEKREKFSFVQRLSHLYSMKAWREIDHLFQSEWFTKYKYDERVSSKSGETFHLPSLMQKAKLEVSKKSIFCYPI